MAFLYLLIKKANGEYSFIICPSRGLFDVDCYFCGMTRAFISLFHLKFNAAINYNPLVIIFYPLLVFIAIQDTLIILKDKIKKENNTSFIEYLIKKIC